MCTDRPTTPASDTTGRLSTRGVADLLRLCEGRVHSIAEKWEDDILSWSGRKAVRERPCLSTYDANLLILAEAWHKDLNKLMSLESGDTSADGYWPWAVTFLNFLVMTCHTIVYRYYMCFPGFRQSGETHATRSIDSMGRGIPESDVAAARSVLVELTCVNFGIWLEKFEDDDLAKFKSRRSSFNVSFTAMDIEWVTVDGQGDFQHVWARLSLGRLFPKAKTHPEQFSGPELQKKQRANPLMYFGTWGDQEDDVSQPELEEINIGWKVSPPPTAVSPDAKDSKENRVDVSGGNPRPKIPEPGTPGLSTAPLESREDWFFPFMRSLVQDLEMVNLRVTELESKSERGTDLASTNERVTELEDDLSELHSNFNHVRICLEKVSRIIHMIRDDQLSEDELVHVSNEISAQELLVEGR
ncbi:hypothetical protein F5B18DRAFT_239095 [Nemania serpens]|nr:hypothetical protein F5B18DRAFT_239095 [Nemania serpens]